MLRHTVRLAALVAILPATGALAQYCPSGSGLVFDTPAEFRTGAPWLAEPFGCEAVQEPSWTEWFYFDGPGSAPTRLQIVACSSSATPFTLSLLERTSSFECGPDTVVACGAPCPCEESGNGLCIWFDAIPATPYRIRLSSPEGAAVEGTIIVRRPGIESRLVVTRAGDEDEVFPPNMGDGSEITVQPGDEIIVTTQVRHIGGEGRYEGILSANAFIEFVDWPGAGELTSHEATYLQMDPFDVVQVRGGYWPAWSFSQAPVIREPTSQNTRRSVRVGAIQFPAPGSYQPSADGEWMNLYSFRYHISDMVERVIYLNGSLISAAPFYIRDDGYAWWDDSRGQYHVNKNVHQLLVHVDGVTFPCPCDVDDNADVDVFDLIDFVNLHQAADLAADYDGNGSVDIYDLLGFLECWFPASGGLPCR